MDEQWDTKSIAEGRNIWHANAPVGFFRYADVCENQLSNFCSCESKFSERQSHRPRGPNELPWGCSGCRVQARGDIKRNNRGSRSVSPANQLGKDALWG